MMCERYTVKVEQRIFVDQFQIHERKHQILSVSNFAAGHGLNTLCKLAGL